MEVKSPTFFPPLIKEINESIKELLTDYSNETLIEFPPFSSFQEEQVLSILRDFTILTCERNALVSRITSISNPHCIASKFDATEYVKNLFPSILRLLFMDTLPYITIKGYKLKAEDFN